MTDVSIPPFLRRKIENLGFYYDPIHDEWYQDYKRKIRLSFDRSAGMFLWTVYMDDYLPIYWNQTIEKFKKLKRKTVNYYIGDKVRNYFDRNSN